jgi:DNA-binding CsgD family transcriptional regulator
MKALFATAPPEAFDALMHPPIPVTTHREIMRGTQRPVAEFIDQSNKAHGMGDVLGIVTHPTHEHTVVFWAVHDEEISLTGHDRELLHRVGAHLESGYRARKAPASVIAIIEPDGRVVTRSGEAPSRDTLEERARRTERARSSATRKNAEAITLWPALVEGRASLVPKGSGLRRRYEVIDNPPHAMTLRALTKGELDVLERCARGLSTKLIAYALGLSPSTVSTRLARAAAKLGVASRLELLRIAAILSGDPRLAISDDALSGAEREVVDLLELGLSNAQIGRLRSRSSRTIANQVASLLRKTKTSSRRELVARRARTR